MIQRTEKNNNSFYGIMKNTSRRIPEKIKLYCIDCGTQLSLGLTLETHEIMREMEMPKMLIFCDSCRDKLKNKLKRTWAGFKYLFEN